MNQIVFHYIAVTITPLPLQDGALNSKILKFTSFEQSLDLQTLRGLAHCDVIFFFGVKTPRFCNLRYFVNIHNLLKFYDTIEKIYLLSFFNEIV